jgi:hypothetical protein
MIGKDRIVFDPANAAETDNVGAYVRSNNGHLITDHDIVEQQYANLVSQGLIFKSKLPGAIGNTYSFQVIDSTGSGPLSFTEIAGAIVLDLNGLTPTTTAVAAFLAASTYADVSVGTPGGNVVVASVVSFTNGQDSVVHHHLDVYAALADGDGNPITSTDGALDVNIKTSDIAIDMDLDGIYNVSTNPVPDNVGIIGSSRAAPGLANQTLQFTGAGVASDAVVTTNIVAQDVNSFGMIWNGTTWDRLKGVDGAVVTTTDVNDTLAHAAATVSTTAAAITAALATRRRIIIQNVDNSKSIYLGTASVTTATGLRLSPGAALEIELAAATSIYAITASPGTASARVLETGLA